MYADGTSRRRLSHDAHRARRLNAMDAKHTKFDSIDINHLKEHVNNHWRRDPLKRRLHGLKRQARNHVSNKHQTKRRLNQMNQNKQKWNQLQIAKQNIEVQKEAQRKEIVETQREIMLQNIQQQKMNSIVNDQPLSTSPCNDGIQNNDESDIDCGGNRCKLRCTLKQKCMIDYDCHLNDVCVKHACSPNMYASDNIEDQTKYAPRTHPLFAKKPRRTTTLFAKNKKNEKKSRQLTENTLSFEDALAKMGDKRGGEGETKQPGIYRFGIIVSVWEDIALRAKTNPSNEYPKLDELKIAYADKIKEYIDWVSYGDYAADVDIYFHNNTNTEFVDEYDAVTGNTNTICNPQSNSFVHSVNRDYNEMQLDDGQHNAVTYNEDDYDIHVRMIWATSCVGGAGAYQNQVTMTVAQNNRWALWPASAPFELESSQKVVMHEVVHAMGVQLHMNRIQCDPPSFAPAGMFGIASSSSDNWRNCPVKEYGNVHDILGEL